MSAAKQYVDTAELTRFGQEVSGQTLLESFDRLVEDLPDQGEAQVSWSVRGERTMGGQFFLHVQVQGAVTLECQRCMQPVLWPIDFNNRLQVVRSEAAEAEDAYVEGAADDFVERIAGSPRLDVLALVEDEIILGLPYVPKHDVCPSAPDLETDAEADPGRPSPFLVLGQLKKD